MPPNYCWRTYLILCFTSMSHIVENKPVFIVKVDMNLNRFCFYIFLNIAFLFESSIFNVYCRSFIIIRISACLYMNLGPAKSSYKPAQNCAVEYVNSLFAVYCQRTLEMWRGSICITRMSRYYVPEQISTKAYIYENYYYFCNKGHFHHLQLNNEYVQYTVMQNKQCSISGPHNFARKWKCNNCFIFLDIILYLKMTIVYIFFSPDLVVYIWATVRFTKSGSVLPLHKISVLSKTGGAGVLIITRKINIVIQAPFGRFDR